MEQTTTNNNQMGAAATSVTALNLLKRPKCRPRNHHKIEESSSKRDQSKSVSSSPYSTKVAPELPFFLYLDRGDRSHNHAREHEWFHFNCNNHSNRGITEISGPAGSGKTQLALSLTVTCVTTTTTTATSTSPSSATRSMREKNNSNSCIHENISKRPRLHFQQNPHNRCNYQAMYISMGNEGFQSAKIAKRLYQMTEERLSLQVLQKTLTKNNDNDIFIIRNILERIHTKHVHNEEELYHLLFDTLPSMLQHAASSNVQTPFGLIVLDSIAGIFRTPEEGEEENKTNVSNDDEQNNKQQQQQKAYNHSFYQRRSQVLFTISAQLKYLSDKYNVSIVVINQVSNIIPQSDSLSCLPNYKGMMIKPSLGLSWSHCVNDRYIITRFETNGNTEDLQDPRKQRQSSTGTYAIENDVNKQNKTNRIQNNNSSLATCSRDTVGNTKFERKIQLLASSRFSIDKEAYFRIEACGVVLDDR